MPRINNTEKVIDSRDIAERIEELEYNLQSDAEELRQLEALRNQAKYHGRWEYGEPLVRYDYFNQHIGEVIASDYSEVDFDGVSYFIRS